MVDEDIQHLDAPMARVVLTVGVVLMAAVLMVALLLATGCVVQVRQEDAPELAKLVDTDEPPAASITREGDSDNAPISIQAE